jgi:hypothetical protein
LAKFTTSLSTAFMRSRVAPRALERGADEGGDDDDGDAGPWDQTGRGRAGGEHGQAAMPASVPSSETAPSVPGGTRPEGGRRYVVRPNAWPISLDTVSAAAVAKATAAGRTAS